MQVTSLPTGYTQLGPSIRTTEFATLFRLGTRSVWVPKSVLRDYKGGTWAPDFVIRKGHSL